MRAGPLAAVDRRVFSASCEQEVACAAKQAVGVNALVSRRPEARAGLEAHQFPGYQSRSSASCTACTYDASTASCPA
jgi:hypothetical protein